MGLFDSLRRATARPVDDATTLRRNALASAIDAARKPAPAPASRRRISEVNSTAARMLFASGDVGRLTGDWSTNPMPADWIVSRFQRTLVARSREQAHNNDIMVAFLRLQRLNIIGPKGVVFHSQANKRDGTPDKLARSAINRWFAKWGERENCDVTGKLSWRAMQGQCVETCARDGEFFVRMIFGDDGGPMRFALQMVDPQRCPVEMDRNDLANGAFVRHGIEFNRYGKPIAYYFTDSESGRTSQAYTYSGKTYVRVPADEVIHGFIATMPGQKRGLPWASTGLYRAKQTSAMEDAAVVNARVGAGKMGVIQFEAGYGPEYDEDEDLTIDAEPGSFPILPEGATLEKFDPLYPVGELVPFVKLMHRGFAAGGGVTYHSLTGDLTEVNFSSIRHGTLDERETYKEKQSWIIEELCDRVKRVGLSRALLAGQVVFDDGKKLPAVNIDAYMEGTWQARRWSWIDPRADVDASEGWKNNLMASPSSLIREEGEDPLKVWTEIGADIKAMQEAGIPMEVIAVSFGQKPTPPQPKDEKGNPQP